MQQKRLRILFGSPFHKRLRQLRYLLSGGNHFLPGALPPFLFFLVLFLVYNLFAIRHVDCFLNADPCPAEIRDKTNRYLGSNMLLLNQKKLSQSISASHPVEKVSVAFKIFNTLRINIDGQLTALAIQVALVQTLPVLSLDQSGSTESAFFTRPTEEIETFGKSQSFTTYEIWASGLMIPVASAESKIKYFFTEKPSPETVKSVFSLLKLVERYLSVEKYWILDDRVFLRPASQPDIIVSIPYEEASLVQVLQSYAYLTTIKKDTKVIDLRFKNPILR